MSVTIAAGLLAKTVNTARSIDGKAKSISSTGGTINASTDAIAELVQTNKIARSILKTASPLEGVLTKIEARAKSINSDATSIDGLASSILATAGTVNTTATSINGSATSINSVAGEINGTAGDIDDDRRQHQQRRRHDQLDGEDDPHHRRPGAGILGIARTIDNDATTIVGALNRTLASRSRSRSTPDSSSRCPTRSSIRPAASTTSCPARTSRANQCQGKQP